MSRTRAANFDDQQAMILSHAAHLFAQRGYMATSMNQVAEACGLSKATLYHYHRDKYGLLVSIAEGHVTRLHELVLDVMAQKLNPDARLRELIRRLVTEYADAQDAHRVLTEDVKFLLPDDRARVLGREREVVAGFARAVTDAYPQTGSAQLSKPLSMLLFGMINWLFTWMKPGGNLTFEAMADIVADLFSGGVPNVKLTQGVEASK